MSSSDNIFDYLIFIGRFQPFHLAHQETINIAFQHSKNVILILGSAQDERTLKNPFLVEERKNMILSCFSEEQQQHLYFVPIIDLYDDEKWLNAVKNGVNAIVSPLDKVGLIGHFKDESSYYLKLFPEWQLLELDNLQNALSATPLREQYYQGHIVTDKFSPTVQHFLANFQKSTAYQALARQYQDLNE